MGYFVEVGRQKPPLDDREQEAKGQYEVQGRAEDQQQHDAHEPGGAEHHCVDGNACGYSKFEVQGSKNWDVSMETPADASALPVACQHAACTGCK